MTSSTRASSRRLRLDKQAFFELCHYRPHPGQLEIHRAREPRRIVACGVRWGKTLCAAMEGLAAAMEPRERSIGWVVAPTYDLADRVFREIQLLAAQHLRHRIVAMKDHERRLVLRNLGGGTSEIRGKSADNPVSLLGEGLDWVIVDEAARLKPTIWQSHLSQRLLDKRGWALLISTPRGKGYLYDLFQRGQGKDPDYRSWNYPSWTNPLLDRELIEVERGRLPERVFLQEYGAEFVEGSGAVFRGVRDCASGELRDPELGQRYWIGVDLAKVEDFTVVVVLSREREVVHFDRFHRLDWDIQIGRIRAIAERYPHNALLVDSTGAGEPVYESMLHAGCRAKPYPFTQRSKAALVNALAMMFEQRKIVIPRPELWPEAVEELEAFEYSITDAGTVRTSAPAGMHDDIVMALALAAWELRPSQPDLRWSYSTF
jgi:Terminase RNaseH-like domain/Terminase large subunit, T4likevirus-type, N-terminal